MNCRSKEQSVKQNLEVGTDKLTQKADVTYWQLCKHTRHQWKRKVPTLDYTQIDSGMVLHSALLWGYFQNDAILHFDISQIHVMYSCVRLLLLLLLNLWWDEFEQNPKSMIWILTYITFKRGRPHITSPPFLQFLTPTPFVINFIL